MIDAEDARYNPEDEQHILAAYKVIADSGYFGSPLEVGLRVITNTIVHNAKEACLNGEPEKQPYYKGLVQGALAVTAHLHAIRERAEEILKAQGEQRAAKDLPSSMSMGDGTLSGMGMGSL